MPNYMIEGQTLTDIADAIRAKTGSSDPITGANMASEIENIPSGDDDIKGLVTAGNAYYFNESTYASNKQTVDCYCKNGDTVLFAISHGNTLTLPTGVTSIATSRYDSNGIKLTFAKFTASANGMQRFKFTQDGTSDFFITYAVFRGLANVTYTGNFATLSGQYDWTVTVPNKVAGAILFWGCTGYAYGVDNPSQWSTTPNDITYLGWETYGVPQSAELRPRCCAFYDNGEGSTSRTFSRNVGSVGPVVDAVELTFS